ncbi:MEG-12, partial [Schistosoma mansoni]
GENYEQQLQQPKAYGIWSLFSYFYKTFKVFCSVSNMVNWIFG